MATALDFFGLLGNFSAIFTFILIFALLYAVFQFSKVFGDNKGIHALVAIIIALIASISSKVVIVINTMIPWFVLLFMLIIFILIGFKIFGVSDSQLLKVIKQETAIIYWIISLSVIILAFSLNAAFGQELLELQDSGEEIRTATNGTGEPGTSQGIIFATFAHPKILGMLVVLLIGVFTILSLTKGMEKK